MGRHRSMPTSQHRTAIYHYRIALGLFIIGLIVSGVTAFPLRGEVGLLADWFGVGSLRSADGLTGLRFWIVTVKLGLADTYAHYPWIGYGTDWLAFGHIVIAFFFVGPLVRPAGGRATLLAGIAACVAVIPLAFICGAIRGIPVYWRLIDCSFGVGGIVPLSYCLRLQRKIESTEAGRGT